MINKQLLGNLGGIKLGAKFELSSLAFLKAFNVLVLARKKLGSI